MNLANPFPGYEVLVYDIETYQNMFLVVFYDGTRFQYYTFERQERLLAYLHDKNKILIGYNSVGFDDIILKGILCDKVGSDAEAYDLAQRIIAREPDNLVKQLQYRMSIAWGRSVDLMALGFKDDDSGAGKASLKDIAIRLQCDKIQDLPYRFDSVLSLEQKREVVRYCENDVLVAVKLWNELYDRVVLRQELEEIYGVDVFTHTNAQICETVFLELYSQRLGIAKSQLREYKSDVESIEVAELLPPWVEFSTPVLRDLLAKLRLICLVKSGDKWINRRCRRRSSWATRRTSSVLAVFIARIARVSFAAIKGGGLSMSM